MSDTWDTGSEETKGYGFSLSNRVVEKVSNAIKLYKEGRLTLRELTMIVSVLDSTCFPFLTTETREFLYKVNGEIAIERASK